MLSADAEWPLKAPAARAASAGVPQHQDGGRAPSPAGEAGRLLPTPSAADGAGGHTSRSGARKGEPLLGGIAQLLPTPVTSYSQRTPGQRRAGRPAGNGTARARIGDLGIVAEHLLPTPNATDGKGGNRPIGRMREGRPRTIADADLPAAIDLLLPAPQAAGGSGGPRQVPETRTHRGTGHGPVLQDMAPALLPTPTAKDAANARNATAGRSPGSAHHTGTTLCDVFHEGGALPPAPSAGNFSDGEDPASREARRQRNLAKAAGTDWGPYAAAVRNWETVTCCLAPCPTVLGKTGQRLNPALPEWMMGIPAGWVTGTAGLSRTAQLRIVGNGVCPQQGALALRLLLARGPATAGGEV